MRYYAITLTNATTGASVLPSSLGGLPLSSLLPNGNFNPAALNIEFDIPVANAGIPVSNAYMRIWGLSIKDITQALSLTPASLPGVNIKMLAGMSKGLPLAKPGQQGTILVGSIFQAWGNWVGTEQTLDLTFNAVLGTSTVPKNLQFIWQQGTSLQAAIQNTLQTAFPGKMVTFGISSNLVLPNTETGTYQSANEFATYLNGISKMIMNGSGQSAVPNYQGIMITPNGNGFTVSDCTQTTNSTVKAIAFEDMVGQPTWAGPNEISIKVVLRGDLDLFNVISLPPSLATQTQQSLLRFNQDQSAFTGNFIITQMQHYGNFRQPDAASWNTTIRAISQPKGT